MMFLRRRLCWIVLLLFYLDDTSSGKEPGGGPCNAFGCVIGKQCEVQGAWCRCKGLYTFISKCLKQDFCKDKLYPERGNVNFKSCLESGAQCLSSETQAYCQCDIGMKFNQTSRRCEEMTPCDILGCKTGEQCEVNDNICECLNPYTPASKCQIQDFCQQELDLVKEQVNSEYCTKYGAKCEFNATQAYCTCETGMKFNYGVPGCEEICQTCNASQCEPQDGECVCLGLWNGEDCLTYNYCKILTIDNSLDPTKVVTVKEFCENRNLSCIREADSWTCECDLDTEAYSHEKERCMDACENYKSCTDKLKCESYNHLCTCLDPWMGEHCDVKNRCLIKVAEDDQTPLEICRSINASCEVEKGGWHCKCEQNDQRIAEETFECVHACTNETCKELDRCEGKNHTCQCKGIWSGDECEKEDYCQMIVPGDSLTAEKWCKNKNSLCSSSNATWTCSCIKDSEVFDADNDTCKDACISMGCEDETRCISRYHRCECLGIWEGDSCDSQNFCRSKLGDDTAEVFCLSINARCASRDIDWTCECEEEDRIYDEDKKICANPCDEYGCLIGDQCKVQDGGCTCLGLYSADSKCHQQDMCKEPDLSSGNVNYDFCSRRNDAKCISNGTHSFCECDDINKTFNIDIVGCIDACSSVGCEEETRCVSKNQRCECLDIWEGKACDIPNFCKSKLDTGSAKEFCESVKSLCVSNGTAWTCHCEEKDEVYNEDKTKCENPCVEYGCVVGEQCKVQDGGCTCLGLYSSDSKCQQQDMCKEPDLSTGNVNYDFCARRNDATCKSNVTHSFCECDDRNKTFNMDIPGCVGPCLSKGCNESQCVPIFKQCQCLGLWDGDNCQTLDHCKTIVEGVSQQPPEQISAKEFCEQLDKHCVTGERSWTCSCDHQEETFDPKERKCTKLGVNDNKAVIIGLGSGMGILLLILGLVIKKLKNKDKQQLSTFQGNENSPKHVSTTNYKNVGFSESM